MRISSASPAAWASRRRASALADHPPGRAGRPAHRRRGARIIGSRKSGPHLNTRTRRPWRACRAGQGGGDGVLPWPEAGAATSRADQRTWVMDGTPPRTTPASEFHAFCALIPALNACLTRPISVTVSAASDHPPAARRARSPHHMLHGRARLDVGQDPVQRQVAVLEGDVQFVQHHQADGRVGQQLRGDLPGFLGLGDVALAVLGLPGETLRPSRGS
ncbi:Uncharacterised protein [Pseudomonas aeruginosa]|nr:Uncharacterised protein [Pseudomonas aeruginosa]